ncbi:GNAT family N-acetyltransferase [Chelatococcus sp. SYSU_G07232]|uniref:GNAT family N-acetyltransferase n=1 Tax=Chelatococcus albus TaxID=3047466 RepID=A0ABT7AFZ2_9HYPH|nr:GNAT family N-acetyltransferase [Chelatococcus sp. SYSU_G07232]MDJ1157556.1 GNAT family N-acetyltransferase [Chelatococcus sp. SYSU_G07232]
MLNRTLDTSRLILCPIALEDAGALHREMTWEVVRWLSPVPWPQPLAAMRGFCARAAEDMRRGAAAHHVVLADGRTAGLISLMPADGAMELGYWLGPSFWGRGLMSEAAETYVDAFFAETQAVHMTSGVFADNRRSLRIQERLGFVVVGEGLKFSKAHGRYLPHVTTMLGRARRRQPALAA